jgi:hypothetical protein
LLKEQLELQRHSSGAMYGIWLFNGLLREFTELPEAIRGMYII